jgi:hypothetical protein
MEHLLGGAVGDTGSNSGMQRQVLLVDPPTYRRKLLIINNFLMAYSAGVKVSGNGFGEATRGLAVGMLC